MEAQNTLGNLSLPSAAASTDGAEAASPLKFQVEVTMPRELGSELAAWRKTFERFTSVMERWLESSLAHPGLPTPPSMPRTIPPARVPEPVAPQVAVLVETPPPSVPADMPPVLVVEPPAPIAAAADKIAAQEKIEVEFAATPTTGTASVQQAIVQAQQGERHRAAGQKEQALLCYQEALALDPECAQAYLGRASVYIEQGRLNEALLDCNTALRREPERAVLYVLRGLVYTRLGNLQRALDEADEAVRLDPHLPSAYMLRGTARFKKGMLGEALTDVKEAIRLRPNDVRFHGELARFLTQTGQHEQAARAYAKILELSPNAHMARFHRGAALRQAGDAAAAEAELTEYLRRGPATAAAHYERGLCRLAQRNYAQAMTDFDKAIALKPDDRAAYEAKEKTLRQWEGTARQSRSSGKAATVALAATATDIPSTTPTASFPSAAKPTPAKTSSAKAPPARNRAPARSRFGRGDAGEPRNWPRPALWACGVVLAGLMTFGGVRLLANVIHNPHKPENLPPTSATLSADELVQRFTSNPTAAKTELSENYLEVNGWVARYFADKTPPLIILAAIRSNTAVTCTLKPNPKFHQQMLLSRIEGECQITLVGKCAGPQGHTLALNECQLVKVFKGKPRPRQ